MCNCFNALTGEPIPSPILRQLRMLLAQPLLGILRADLLFLVIEETSDRAIGTDGPADLAAENRDGVEI